MSQRYASRPFPAYAHVPGSGTPHPTRDPAGHSHGRHEPMPPFALSAWRDHEPYRYGIDLHNHRYHWECHEVLEGVWRTMDLASPAARFVQALIQLSVAHSHVIRGRSDVAAKLAGWADEKLAGHAGVVGGIDIDNLRAAIGTWRADPAAGGLIRLTLIP